MTMRHSRCAGLIAGAITLALCAPAHAATAAVASGELTAAAATLGAGEYSWDGAAAPFAAGPVTVVVSIPLQQLFVYRGAQLIAVSAVSTGSPGHETPVGEFTVLQKDVSHKSNRYNDAPMPYMQRLTWDGVAIHGGRDPGYPASHGCVRVPLAFARRLYAITSLGAHVSVVDDATAPGLPDDYMRLAPLGDAASAADPETDATRDANLAQAN
jgi:hypothetical protein